MAINTMKLRLNSIRYAATDTSLFEFCADDGRQMPPADAGSHVDIHLPGGIKQYSLVIRDQSTESYIIGVKLDPASRGGSKFLHETARVGQTFEVSAPRNNFKLEEGAPHTVLIAGGIGITPILSMMYRLEELGKSWELHYASRAREHMAFLRELSGFAKANLHFDSEAGGPLDINRILETASAVSHAYCCGPVPMLASFEKAATRLPVEQRHVEYFQAKEMPTLEGGFTVELARSKKELVVPDGATILSVIEAAGVSVDHSCSEGICGVCETRVISGIPEHRDSVLTPAEKASNTKIMICCSGAKSARLVLDL